MTDENWDIGAGVVVLGGGGCGGGIEACWVAGVENGIAAQVSSVAKDNDQKTAAFGSSYRAGGGGEVMDCFCFIGQALSGFFYCGDRDA